jgi:nucleoside-diphosphate-sugar epimerase
LKVLVTGASGFLGSHLLPALVAQGYAVRASSRSPVEWPDVEWRQSPELDSDADWSALLRGASAVVHLAGRAHVLSGRNTAEDRLCHRINAEGTRRLAGQAAEAGVKHFILLSSCHAVAEDAEEMLTRETKPRPASAYGRSKLAAEKALRDELEQTECGWTILRPPLVYGAGQRANFARLAELVRCGWPMPLAGVENRRSFLGVQNLADFVARPCLGHPVACRRKIYYPADAEDLSTPELLRLLARSMDVRARLFPVPRFVLQTAGCLPGFRALRKLMASLFVDAATTNDELGWVPPHNMRSLLDGFLRVAS